MKTQDDLFTHFLKDMYYAERAILKSLPELIGAAQSDQLKQALQDHAEETRTQVGRLDQVFRAFGQPAEGVTCEAMVGLLQDSADVLKESGNAGPIRDAAIIACAQAVEHYEIARYGTLAGGPRTWVGPGWRPPRAILAGGEAGRRRAQRIAVGGINQAAGV